MSLSQEHLNHLAIAFSGLEEPCDWKTRSDRRFTPADAEMVWRSIQEYLPEVDKILFVSPSANYPSHELAILATALADKKEIQVIASDIADINLPGPAQEYISRGAFQYHKCEAAHIPDEVVPPGNASVIWDRRGALWFTIAFFVNNDPKKKEMVIENFHYLLGIY